MWKGVEHPLESEKPRRWKSEVSLASDPSTGMDAALSQILPKIESPATAKWLLDLSET
jgi:hypothetical protein